MLEIYVPNPVVVGDALVFQAHIQHDGKLITVEKPLNGTISLHYDNTPILHDKYYQDPEDDIHQSVYTLPDQRRICVIWVPRPMRYAHIHIQAPRLLVQISTTPNTHQ
jgi:hypothetical protein